MTARPVHARRRGWFMAAVVLVAPWLLFFAGEVAVNGRSSIIVDW